MKFDVRNKGKQVGKNKQPKQSKPTPAGENNESGDTHYEEMLKGVDKQFSVFSRRKQREEKKIVKKQKKQQFFETSKEQKKKDRIEEIKEQMKKEEEKALIEAQKKANKGDEAVADKGKQAVQKDVLKQQQEEQRRKKREREDAEREKQALQERIKMDEEEVHYFESLLGKNKSKQGEKKFKKEISQEGWDDDLFSFLDNISSAVKTDVKTYQPFFKEEGVLEDLEIDELVKNANAPITIDKKKQIKKEGEEEEEEENSDQEGFSDEGDDSEGEENEGDEDEEEDGGDDEDEEENEGEEDEDDEEDVDEEEEEENEDEEEDSKINAEEDEEEQDYYDDEVDDEDDDDDIEEDDSSYMLVEEEQASQQNKANPEQPVKSILKGQTKPQAQPTPSSVNKPKESANQSKQLPEKTKAPSSEPQGKQELTEMQKWMLEKEAKKNAGLTEEQKERARVLAELEKKDFEKRNQVRKAFVNAFNRLSETNIDIVFKQIQDCFEGNAKTMVSGILSEIFMKTTIEPVKVAQHIMASYSVVVSAVHQIYDNDCFGPVMKALLLSYESIISNPNALREEDDEEENQDSIDEDYNYQKLRNITMVFSYFYLFDNLSIDFISGYLNHLLEHINTRTLDALLILVQHVGAKIRQDNPSILKSIIDATKAAVEVYSQKKIAAGKQVSKKVEFVMLTLNEIRLNKKQKADPAQRLQFFIQWMKKNVLQKMRVTSKQFPVDFKAAYNAKKDTPRWYSQFETGAYRHDKDSQSQLTDEQQIQNDLLSSSEFSDLNAQTKLRLEQLAVQCRMTSDTKKRIFMMIMSADDYIEAAQRVLKLKINKHLSNECGVVIVQCCAMESTFNPFYVHLTQKLIQVNPKGKFAFQYALWDQFKLIESADIRKINNLAKYLALLCASKTLGITALKFFELDNPSEHTIIFLKIFLFNFFTKISGENLEVQLSKATAREENYVFVEALKDFLRNYYWKFVLKSEKYKNNEHLKEAIKISVKKLKIQLTKQQLQEAEE